VRNQGQVRVVDHFVDMPAQWTELARVTVPLGSYVLSANAVFSNAEVGGRQGLQCLLGPSEPYGLKNFVTPVGLPDQGAQFEITMIDDVVVGASGGAIVFQCHVFQNAGMQGHTSSAIYVNFSRMSVLRVGQLNSSGNSR